MSQFTESIHEENKIKEIKKEINDSEDSEDEISSYISEAIDYNAELNKDSDEEEDEEEEEEEESDDGREVDSDDYDEEPEEDISNINVEVNHSLLISEIKDLNLKTLNGIERLYKILIRIYTDTNVIPEEFLDFCDHDPIDLLTNLCIETQNISHDIFIAEIINLLHDSSDVYSESLYSLFDKQLICLENTKYINNDFVAGIILNDILNLFSSESEETVSIQRERLKHLFLHKNINDKSLFKVLINNNNCKLVRREIDLSVLSEKKMNKYNEKCETL